MAHSRCSINDHDEHHRFGILYTQWDNWKQGSHSLPERNTILRTKYIKLHSFTDKESVTLRDYQLDQSHKESYLLHTDQFPFTTFPKQLHRTRFPMWEHNKYIYFKKEEKFPLMGKSVSVSSFLFDQVIVYTARWDSSNLTCTSLPQGNCSKNG